MLVEHDPPANGSRQAALLYAVGGIRELSGFDGWGTSVLGDNRSFSQDSYDFWPVPRDAIFGRTVLIYWPLDESAFLAPTLRASRGADSDYAGPACKRDFPRSAHDSGAPTEGPRS